MRTIKRLLYIAGLLAFAAAGFFGYGWWRARIFDDFITQCEREPHNNPLSIHIRLPEDGSIECEYRAVTLDEIRTRVKMMNSVFCPWSVRPVLHVNENTPFPTFMRVIDLLKLEGGFVISLAYQSDGKQCVFDLPDHYCRIQGRTHITAGVSHTAFWIESPSNVVDKAILQDRLASVQREGGGHLSLIVDEEETNLGGMLDLISVARRSGFTEATLRARLYAQPVPPNPGSPSVQGADVR